MNQLERVWCRGAQAVMKYAMYLLPYRSPEVLTSTRQIPDLLKRKKADRVLVVTDGAVRALGLLGPMEEALAQAGIVCEIYDKTVPNPTIANVEEALELYRRMGGGAIIGFGGGSAIDCAKAVAARAAKPRQSIQKMKGILKIHWKLPLVIAVPTTAGTGSETTVTTVITDGVTRHKFPINDPVLIPRGAVHDPEVTRSLPPSVTATTGMDALTHAVEAYINRSTTAGTRRDSIEAARLVMTYLERAYENGDDMEARAGMLKAAFLAGRAFSRAYVGYCHGVAHSLGGQYNIPHGLANAVLLPWVLEEYGQSAHKSLKELAVAVGLAKESDPADKAAARFIEEIRAMNRRMNIPDKLQGIRAEDIPALAEHAHRESNPLYPVPRLMDAGELEVFYHKVME